MKVLVVGGHSHYASWILRDIELLDPTIENVKLCDLIILPGGADVNPNVYGHKRSSRTYFDDNSDKMEMDFYKAAKSCGIPIVGICKGAQMITALQKGGCLMQHVTGHANGSSHQIFFEDGDNAIATSTHHQMMYPFNVPGYELIAWAEELSDIYEYNGNNTTPTMPGHKEPEIVYYSNTQALAIQPHPEMMSKASRLVVKLNDLLKEKFNL